MAGGSIPIMRLDGSISKPDEARKRAVPYKRRSTQHSVPTKHKVSKAWWPLIVRLPNGMAKLALQVYYSSQLRDLPDALYRATHCRFATHDPVRL